MNDPECVNPTNEQVLQMLNADPHFMAALRYAASTPRYAGRAAIGREITCREADALLPGLVMISGRTDTDEGIYHRIWGTEDGTEVLRDESGHGGRCRHWALRDEAAEWAAEDPIHPYEQEA